MGRPNDRHRALFDGPVSTLGYNEGDRGSNAMDERRKIPRRRILKSGKILLGRRQVQCTVRNLSAIGACLVVQTTYGIPATFEFVMPDQLPKTCKVMWRDDTRLGVHFR
jgi:hypothetical protein